MYPHAVAVLLSYEVTVLVVEEFSGREFFVLPLPFEANATLSWIFTRFLFRDTRFPLFPTPPGRSVSSSWVMLGRCFDLLKKLR